MYIVHPSSCRPNKFVENIFVPIPKGIASPHTWCIPYSTRAPKLLKFHSIFINTLGRGAGGLSLSLSLCIGTGRVIKDKLICNPRSLIRRVEVNRGTDRSVSPVATCLHRDIIIPRRRFRSPPPLRSCVRECACVQAQLARFINHWKETTRRFDVDHPSIASAYRTCVSSLPPLCSPSTPLSPIFFIPSCFTRVFVNWQNGERIGVIRRMGRMEKNEKPRIRFKFASITLPLLYESLSFSLSFL